jgi:hypothetical protein
VKTALGRVRPALALLAVLVFPAPLAAAGRPALMAARCSLGPPIAEHVLLRPKPGTFYSVDALNPDVVYYHSRYLLFFSGNSSPTAGGDWRTGLATAKRPWGPFEVDTRVSEDFYNGGTIIRDGRLLHGANAPASRSAALFSSANGRRWRRHTTMPSPRTPSWRFFQSDLFLDARPRQVDVYFAGRPGATGADLGVAHYRGGRWRGFEKILDRPPGRWDSLDLGEPAVFHVRGRTFMLYGGLGGDGEPRHIGLARRTSKGWQRCGSKPLIAAGRGWYRRNAIDPEPLVVGDRLYVYFGGGLVSSLGGNMAGTIGLRVYRIPRTFR